MANLEIRQNILKRLLYMEEYVVIKRGRSICECIDIPAEFMDIDLEIRIIPLQNRKGTEIVDKIRALYARYPDVTPYKQIEDPLKWQQNLRDR